ncbi:hypothetical protein [Kitasatospora paranensis]|uniref:DUF3040 domain-containing protein n=1 Tax=Kitasatospora paranensis TaxID=258053 RepID=A0ABW2G0L7_9ACTN
MRPVVLTLRELHLLDEIEVCLAHDRRLTRRLARHRVGPRWWWRSRSLVLLLAVHACLTPPALAVVAGSASRLAILEAGTAAALAVAATLLARITWLSHVTQ